ncbi:MAG: damage-inducible protein DinB [Luteitalea sp.]|nr:damage-inducible protein DinB [Luteitalea sp.]
MELTQLFLAELDREAPRTRRALEHVPLGRDDWTPHPKSMPLGRLAGLVASMPSWVSLIIDQDELDLNPPEGRGQYQQPPTDKLAETLDGHVIKARESLAKTNDEFLLTTNWRLLVSGNVVMEQPRHVVLRDTLNHLAHHRGQLTVYLRLNDQPVPAIYGPSADDQQFV